MDRAMSDGGYDYDYDLFLLQAPCAKSRKAPSCPSAHSTTRLPPDCFFFLKFCFWAVYYSRTPVGVFRDIIVPPPTILFHHIRVFRGPNICASIRRHGGRWDFPFPVYGLESGGSVTLPLYSFLVSVIVFYKRDVGSSVGTLTAYS